MNAIDDIKEVFQSFLKLPIREYFETDFQPLYKTCFHEIIAVVIDGEIVSKTRLDDIADLALSQAVQSFGDRLRTWQDDVCTVRSDWCYQRMSTSLNELDNYRSVFGDSCDYLEELRTEARRIVTAIERTTSLASSDKKMIPVEFRTKPISKIKAARLLGRTGNADRAVEWLNKCIADGINAYQQTSRQSGFFDIRDFPEDKRISLTP